MFRGSKCNQDDMRSVYWDDVVDRVCWSFAVVVVLVVVVVVVLGEVANTVVYIIPMEGKGVDDWCEYLRGLVVIMCRIKRPIREIHATHLFIKVWAWVFLRLPSGGRWG